MSPIHYVAVPESDTEIIEEVTYRRKTRQGMKIKHEQAPMEQPLEGATGRASHSRSKNTRQAQLRQGEETVQEPDTPGEGSQAQNKNQQKAKLRQVDEYLVEPDDTGYLDMHEVLEEEGDHLPEHFPEEQPQAAQVFSCIFCYKGIINDPQDTMSQWIAYRGTYLNILLEMEGRKSTPKCSMCSIGDADIKCSDCFGANIFCRTCCLEVHKRLPFHQTLIWTGKHYAQALLSSLDFLLCLGHDGEPCLKTVEVESFEY
jgi:hypothetical protein